MNRQLFVMFSISIISLAGCAQSNLPNQATGIANAGAPSTSSAFSRQAETGLNSFVAVAERGKCPHGKVRTRPCSVKFSSRNSGPDTVGVHYTEVKDGTLAESDTCGGRSGVAWLTPANDLPKISGVVSPAIGQGWFVYPGAQTGSCVATFKYSDENGKKLGQAKLKIENTI
jgi:hypothetical protein